jgi:serine/threonine-protein kinase
LETRRRSKTREFSNEKVPPLRSNSKKTAKPAPPPKETPKEEHFGKFKILKRLGEGGMGTVYKAINTLVDREVALKMIRPEFAMEDEANMQRFHREAMAAAGLIHPNIVSLFSSGEEKGQHYLELEFVDGPSVESLVMQKGKQSVGIAVRIVKDAARGLLEAHSGNIVHRDVKPDNILLSSDGNAKIADFGLAKGYGEGVDHLTMMTQLTQPGMAVGTPHYMSPEQCEAADLDGSSDIYSLGCTFYYLLSGEPPFPGNDIMKIMHQHLLGFPEDLREENQNVPDELNDIIGKMMNKIPDKRYPNMSALIKDLNALDLTAKKQSEDSDEKKDKSITTYWKGLFGKD